jgi:DNA-binding Lrp family transcriptional regulator
MLDKKDLEILEVLKHHAKWTTHHISKKTLIPVTTVHNRIKKLETLGVIKGYTAILDHKKLGESVAAFVMLDIKADNPCKRANEILKELEQFKEVHEAFSITGDHDIVMRISVQDTDKLEEFIERMDDIEGVERARTLVILKGDENHLDHSIVRSS